MVANADPLVDLSTSCSRRALRDRDRAQRTAPTEALNKELNNLARAWR